MKIPDFATKEELFSYLVKNKADIINLKKSVTKFTDCFGVSNFEKGLIQSINKAVTTDTDEIEKTIIGNTYNWMDSHDDMHIDGIFTKSIKDTGKNVLHLHDHQQMLAAKVGIPQKIYEEKVKWTDLGVDRSGSTTCLLMDSNIVKDLNPSIFYQYKTNQVTQHSVGMQYVNLFLCVNSIDPEYKEEFVNWNKFISLMGNPEKAIEQGYFFAITAAKLKEISCVTAGSNELTGMMQDKEPGDSTLQDTTEPGNSTHRKSIFSNFQIIKNEVTS